MKNMSYEKVDGEEGEVEQFTIDLFDKPVYVRTDPFGRIIFDTCASEEEHMAKPLEPGEERRRCRVLLEDFFRMLVGKKGRLLVSWDFQEGA